jgi:hypothetical protein
MGMAQSAGMVAALVGGAFIIFHSFKKCLRPKKTEHDL